MACWVSLKLSTTYVKYVYKYCSLGVLFSRFLKILEKKYAFWYLGIT